MTEREWREASDMRKSTATFAAIVLSAAVLRFWSLGAGLPYSLGVDEPEIMNRAVGMMKSGDFNPRFYDYPAFYIYVQIAVACVRFLAGAMTGEWFSLADAPPEQFYSGDVPSLRRSALRPSRWSISSALRWGTRYALVAAAYGGHAASRPRITLRSDRRPGHVLRHAHVPSLTPRARTGAGDGVLLGRSGGRARRRHQVHRRSGTAAAADRGVDDTRRPPSRLVGSLRRESPVPRSRFFWRRRTRSSTFQGFSTATRS